LVHLGLFFLKVGAFTIGGGLTMIAFIQDQVVGQFGWLTPREFVDGLALGQLTPGPVLMIAAYVGYKLAGIGGAIVAATAAFLPSFIIMLAILPVLDRVRQMAWVKATMKGMAPAVISVLAVSLIRLSPAAVPDPFALLILIGTIAATLALRVGAFNVFFLEKLRKEFLRQILRVRHAVALPSHESVQGIPISAAESRQRLLRPRGGTVTCRHHHAPMRGREARAIPSYGFQVLLG